LFISRVNKLRYIILFYFAIYFHETERSFVFRVNFTALVVTINTQQVLSFCSFFYTRVCTY